MKTLKQLAFRHKTAEEIIECLTSSLIRATHKMEEDDPQYIPTLAALGHLYAAGLRLEYSLALRIQADGCLDELLEEYVCDPNSF